MVGSLVELENMLKLSRAEEWRQRKIVANNRDRECCRMVGKKVAVFCKDR